MPHIRATTLSFHSIPRFLTMIVLTSKQRILADSDELYQHALPKIPITAIDLDPRSSVASMLNDIPCTITHAQHLDLKHLDSCFSVSTYEVHLQISEDRIRVEPLHIDNKAHFISTEQTSSSSYHGPICVKNSAALDTLPYDSYMDWILAEYERLITNNVGVFMPHENLNILSSIALSDDEPRTMLVNINDFINDSVLYQFGLSENKLLSPIFKSYQYIDADLEESLVERKQLSFLDKLDSFVDMRIIIDGLDILSCDRSLEDMLQTAVAYQGILEPHAHQTNASTLLHRQIITERLKSYRNLGYANVASAELDVVVKDDNPDKIHEIIELVYSSFPIINMDITASNLLMECSGNQSSYEKVISGSTRYQLIPTHQAYLTHTGNTVNDFCSYILSSAKPADNIVDDSLPYEEITLNSLMNELVEEEEVNPPPSTRSCDLHHFINTSLSAPKQKDSPHIAQAICGPPRIHPSQRPHSNIATGSRGDRKVSSEVGSNGNYATSIDEKSSISSKISQKRVVSPSVEQSQVRKKAVLRDVDASSDIDHFHIANNSSARDATSVNSRETAPRLEYEPSKHLNKQQHIADTSHESMIDSYLQKIGSANHAFNEEARQGLDTQSETNHHHIIQTIPSSTRSEHLQSQPVVVARNTIQHTKPKPKPKPQEIIHEVSPLHHQSVDVQSSTVSNHHTSSSTDTSSVILDSIFLEQHASVIASLAQAYSIIAVDFKLSAPISAVLDIDTAISFIDCTILQDRESLIAYLRNLIKQSFKYSVIWIVVCRPSSMASHQTSFHDLIKLYQATSQLECNTIFREILVPAQGGQEILGVKSKRAVRARASESDAYASIIHHIHSHVKRADERLTAHTAMLLSEDNVFVAHCEFLEMFPTMNVILAAALRESLQLKLLSTYDADQIIKLVEDRFSSIKQDHIKRRVVTFILMLRAHVGLMMSD
jgi:hypothetical protein